MAGSALTAAALLLGAGIAVAPSASADSGESAGTAGNVAGTAENIVGTAGNASPGGAIGSAVDAVAASGGPGGAIGSAADALGAASVPLPHGSQFMYGEQFLFSGGLIASDFGSYNLLMNPNGALQLRSASGKVLWSTRTSGEGNFAKMGSDGNLTVYTSESVPIWESGTYYPGAFLKVQDDGKMVIYDGVWSVPLWQTCRTGAFCGV